MSSELNPHDLYSDHSSGERADTMQMLGARQVALGLLQSVLAQKNPLDQALARDDAFKALPTRDRAFCRMIVSTTLRRLGQIDDMIAKAETRGGVTKNLMLQNILRMGVAQIIFMDVPDHAAVDTSVRLADAAQMDRQKDFVNGLLRTITREGKEWLSKQDETRLNTPEWLLKIWIAEYGLREAANIARANLVEAPLDITIRDESERNHWGSVFKASQIGAGTLRCPSGGNVTNFEGFDEGRWWVQDASAAIPAALLGNVAGKTVVDLCAAPGGKTMQLAARGANVIALDRSAKRLQKLRENLARVRLEDRVQVEVADAAQWRPREVPQYILLDAPCSATGTVRRHPDVLHLKDPQDIERLASVQERILDNAFDMLAVGGVLVYCTCSLQKSEGEEQIARFLARHENAMKLAISADEIGDMEEPLTEAGDLRILPYHRAAHGGMDGFFISRITKRG